MSNTRRATGTTRTKAAAKAPEQTLSFMGGTYKVADKIGIWPQMQLARAAEAGIMISDPRGLAAVHATLENVIHPDDWGRFQDDMVTKKVDNLAELLKTVADAMQIVVARSNAAEAPADTNGSSNGKADAAVPGTLQVN